MDNKTSNRTNPIVNDNINKIIDVMHWCKDNDVPYSEVKACAEASFTLATGIDSWDCGREEDDTKNVDAVPAS